MKHPRWRVPRMWDGQVVAIIGGGPSLTREQVEACRGRCKVIAVNTSFKLAPFADVLYWCDEAWAAWWRHDPDFKAFAGMKVALSNARTWAWDQSIKVLENYGESGLCEIPDGVMTGRNSGAQAMQLAGHLGARAQLLLGFDMQAQNGRTHWHVGTKLSHQRPTAPQDITTEMLPRTEQIGRELMANGVRVINCSPCSALKAFPVMGVADALDMLEAEERQAREKRKEDGYFKVAGL